VGDVVESWNVPGTELARVGSSDVYSAEVFVAGALNATANYKFYANNSLAFETDFDAATAGDQTRVLILGARDTAETLPVAYFNNVDVVPSNRTVTFAVDMSIQQAMGKFDPATGTVQLRGLGSFDATDKVLTREGTTLIYRGTFVVIGDVDSIIDYKFFSAGVTVSGFEVINPNGLLVNRSLTLGASGSPVVLDTTYFSNQSVVPPSALSYTPSSASGTVDIAISTLTPSVTGTVTSYAVNPTLPLGLSIETSSGIISGTPTAVSASAIYTVTAANGTGSTTATVTIEVAAAPVGSTFAGAYPGANMTDVAPNGLKYLANYAFGGNETTPATLPVQDTSDPTQLRLVVVFRTDDSTLPLSALGGEATTNLSGTWDLPGVTVADGDSTGLPSHLTRKVISVDRGSDPKKFLRATVTK
jgi:hypothetical protein